MCLQLLWKFHFRFFKELKGKFNFVHCISENFPAYLFCAGHTEDRKMVKVHTPDAKRCILYDQQVGSYLVKFTTSVNMKSIYEYFYYGQCNFAVKLQVFCVINRKLWCVWDLIVIQYKKEWFYFSDNEASSRIKVLATPIIFWLTYSFKWFPDTKTCLK